MATKVVVLREMDPQDQIDGLLGMGNIKEAQQIFLTKFAKNTESFNLKRKIFNLDAGWVLLRQG